MGFRTQLASTELQVAAAKLTHQIEDFTDKADLTPYKHAPAQIDLSATNQKNAYGAERSAKMDFSEYDLVDDFELNEILWRAVKGRDAPIPPAVRRAWASLGHGAWATADLLAAWDQQEAIEIGLQFT